MLGHSDSVVSDPAVRKVSNIPLDEKISLIEAAQGKSSAVASSNVVMSNSLQLCCRIRSQFLTVAFIALSLIGVDPISRWTPLVLVCCRTPSNCFRKLMCTRSMGLFFGCFSVPQKSLQYNKIGLTM